MLDLAEKFKKLIEGQQYCPKCDYPIDRCVCRQREMALKQAAEQERKHNIERLGGVRAYEDFNATNYTNKAVLKALSGFPNENYYLWGQAGSGKTHAAVATLRKLSWARVVRMGQISREIRAVGTPEDEERIIERYSTIPMLLDDLGSEKATEFLQGVLFEIMDRRWQNKSGGLIITANMSIDKLGGIIGDRTASRIAGLVGAKNTLEISGTDYRLKGELL